MTSETRDTERGAWCDVRERVVCVWMVCLWGVQYSSSCACANVTLFLRLTLNTHLQSLTLLVLPSSDPHGVTPHPTSLSSSRSLPPSHFTASTILLITSGESLYTMLFSSSLH